LAFNIKAVSFTLAQLNGQFGKLNDPTEGAPVPEPVEGALPKQYIYTVAHASGSEKQCSSFRVSASVFSVKFRVIPWQMLILVLSSVASLLLLLCVASVFVCGYILFSYNLTLNLNI